MSYLFDFSRFRKKQDIKTPLLHEGGAEDKIADKLVDTVMHGVAQEEYAEGVQKAVQQREELVMKFKHQFKKLLHNYIKINGKKIDLQEIFIFEPKGFFQKLDAIYQNTMEIQLLTALILICYSQPSVMSISFMVLTHNILIAATYKSEDRLKWSKRIMFFNIFVLFCVVLQKHKMIKNFPVRHSTQENCEDVDFYYSAWGFYTTRCQNARFLFHRMHSFTFEMMVFVAYGFTVLRIYMAESRIKHLKNKYVSVIMIKNYEIRRQILAESDSEEEQDSNVVKGIGTKNKRQTAKQSKEEIAQNEKKNYKVFMKALISETRFNFLGCYYFQSLNKVLYLWLIIFQLLQTMGFNGLFDIPQLFMILFLASFYAYRKTFFMAYGFLIFFVAYYIQFALTLKLIYGVAMRINFVQEFLKDNNDSPFVEYSSIIFGIREKDADDSETDYFFKRCVYYFSLISCIMLAQSWKQAKWLDIREKLEYNMKATPFNYAISKLVYYLRNRDELKSSFEFLRTQAKQKARLSKQKKKLKQNLENKNFKQSSQSYFSQKDKISTLKQDLNLYLPTLVMWTLRFALIFQSYMYHSNSGMFHLTFCLMSFVLPGNLVLFLSFVIMLPLYSMEFVLMYGMRIPGVNNTEFFQQYGQPFGFKMNFPVLEQFLYFFILTLFCMTISCFKLAYEINQGTSMMNFLINKVIVKDYYQIWWNLLFFVLKYIQSVALVALFINGSNNLNHLRNLGFMLFFVCYTASEYLYRKTSKLLVIFVVFFVGGQYYFSLVYRKYLDDPQTWKTLEWLNLFEEEKKPTWMPSDTIYFRHIPYAFDWVVLLIMCGLNFINQVVFKERETSNQLSQKCYENIRDMYSEQVFFLLSIKNAVSRYVLAFTVILMFGIIGRAQTNIINWGIFILNILNFAFIAKGDNKESTNRRSKQFAIIIKYYSAFFLLFDIFLIVFIGEQEKVNRPNSIDQQFKAAMPVIYQNLDIIGLRMWMDPSEDPLDKMAQRRMLKAKFYSYIAQLMISIYWEKYFQSKLLKNKGLDQYKEVQFKAMFEFKSKEQEQQEQENMLKEQLSKKKEKKIQMKKQSSSQSPSKVPGHGDNEYSNEHSHEDDHDHEHEDGEDQCDGDLNNSKHVKEFHKHVHKSKNQDKVKMEFTRFDMIDIYENVRFTTPFLVYKSMKYWPIFDFLASYGHILNNFVIVWIGIYYNVSFFMLFNIACVCIYYAVATIRLNRRALESYSQSGIQSQTDLKIARMVTKEYKISAFYEFLKIRHQLWKVQSGVLLAACSLGFITTLLSKLRIKLNTQDPIYHSQSISQIDNITFYVFMSGIFKDYRLDQEHYFYVPMFALTLGLVVERQAINWLTDRRGLTYNKLQKCIELDLRKQCIDDDNWGVSPPKYDVDDYKYFYYGADFEDLKQKFSDTDEDNHIIRKYGTDFFENLKIKKGATEKDLCEIRRKGLKDFKKNISEKYQMTFDEINKLKKESKPLKEYREFIPHKVAERIVEFITFSVKLAGRCPDLGKFDDHKAVQMLELFESQRKNAFSITQIDEESVPIMREHKVKFLENQLKTNIDRKYKISFYKGVQFINEALCLLIMMISVVLKSNVFSLIYLVFIYKFLMSQSKASLLVRMTVYISITLLIQYTVFVLNLTAHNSPAPFPSQFTGYPINKDPENLHVQYMFPFFFRYDIFRNLRFSYFLGIGIETAQVQNLLLDFLNLYLVSMYVLTNRNPILIKIVKKIFWRFPSKFEDKAKWERLDPIVKEQINWLYNPCPLIKEHTTGKKHDMLDHKLCEKYKQYAQNMSASEKQRAKDQYLFALEYNKDSHLDLNQILINYIDLKYNQIWSYEQCRKVKRDFKEQSIYYRLVKQGSILVYLCFHIFTILLILLMATLRQSFFALGYVLIFIPRLKHGSEVLMQRNIHQDNEQAKLEEENVNVDTTLQNKKIDAEELREKLREDPSNSQNKNKLSLITDQINQLIERSKEVKAEIKDLKKLSLTKTFEQKQDEKHQRSQGEWPMIKLIQKWIMLYAVFDFTFQIIFQMPLIHYSSILEVIGLRKVWTVENNIELSYSNLVNHLDSQENLYIGFKLNVSNFHLQCINCIVIAIISLQSEIFRSVGYQKFVQQQDGSMDLLIQIADLKAKSIAYCFNNTKIRKIIAIQRSKESTEATVEKIKQKLKRWRLFTRTTLDQRLLKNEDESQKLKMMSTQKEDQSPMFGKNMSQLTDPLINKNQSFVSMTSEFERTPTLPGDSPKKSLKKAKIEQNENIDNMQVKKKRVSQAQAQDIHHKLAQEFVKAKIEKLNFISKIYLYLNNTFVEKIIFKNQKEQLEYLVMQHATGDLSTPTELEQIMYEEAEFLIKESYDNKDGSYELYNLIQRNKGKSNKNLLETTNFDKKIKLKQMRRTWEFTRPSSMIFKIIETMVYVVISQTQNLIYLSMMMSMYMNAGIISIPYPISLFGYALIEETRPRKQYWNFVRQYTTFLLFLKFLMNLSVMTTILESPQFQYYSGYLKLGIYDYPDLGDLIWYQIPEILIITFIMLNEIKLKLTGLYYQIEQDIETVTDGIQRNLEGGDAEKVQQKKIQAACMNLKSYFIPLAVQRKYEEEYRIEEKREEQNQDSESRENTYLLEHDEPLMEQIKQKMFDDFNSYDEQLAQFKEISREVWKSSRKFDIDLSSNEKSSNFDKMIKDNILQKSLENDNLIVIEGNLDGAPEFITSKQIQDDRIEIEAEQAISSGDFELDLDQKIEFLNSKSAPKLGFFEKRPYFEKVFPSLRIQKPGYDLYGSSTVFLTILALYVFMCYSSISVDQASLLDSVKSSNNIFKGEMAVSLIVVIIIIIVERYVNRSDTKAVEQKGFDAKSSNSKEGFFQENEMFKRSSTQRSMTVSLKTMKTADLDVRDNSSQNFLKAMYGGDETGSNNIDNSKTKITSQQKCKFIMHWIILIGSHIFVFWYIPISGNTLLYGVPQCESELEEKYGCKNFHKNIPLRIFYIIISIYLMLSALQMKYGFTIMKRASSVLQFNSNPIALIGAQVFMAIPFAIEVRCVLDFTFSKTALDVFQFWQLFMYHIELFIVKNGNYSYTYKQLGSKTLLLDKCIFGVVIGGVILTMLIGPIYFFSDYGGFIAPNPVKSGLIQIAIIVTKQVSVNDLMGIGGKNHEYIQSHNFESIYSNLTYLEENNNLIFQQTNEIYGINEEIIAERERQAAIEKSKEQKELKSQIPYIIYENKFPFLRQYDDDYYKLTKFNEWTETRYFTPEMLQECIANEYSDELWGLSVDNKVSLKEDLKKAMDDTNNDFFFKLGIFYEFERDLPAENKVAKGAQYRSLNMSNKFDCQTGQQLKNIAYLDCTTPTPGYVNNATVRFSQAITQNVVMGANSNVSEIIREGHNVDNEKHDILLQYWCNNQWNAHSSEKPVKIPAEWEPYLLVDPETCEPVNGPIPDDLIVAGVNELHKNEQTLHDNVIWYRVKFTLFSMMVSASLFASFNITTFYTTVVLVLGSSLRPAFMFGTWTGFIYELTKPDAVIKLIECCYMKRHEEDLIGEEECYRMLQELIRSPELLKSMTGSNLKGSCDPLLDKLSDEDLVKMEHLDRLSRKGFEVDNLKQQIINKYQGDADYNF